LRKSNPNTYPHGNCNSNAKPHGDGYTYIHAKAYAHTEDCTDAEVASDAGAATIAAFLGRA
jgi:hypothetical protein